MSAFAMLIALSVLPLVPTDAPSPRDAADELSAPHEFLTAQDPEGEEPLLTPEEEFTSRIRGHILKITGAWASYDGKILRVIYDDPEEFRGDAEFFGAAGGANAEFRPAYVRVRGDHGIYCFGGHTAGGVLLKPRFVGPVKVQIDVQYQWVDRSSHFITLVHATPDVFRGSDFGIRPVEKLDKKKKIRFHPAEQASFNEDPSKWLDRTDRHNQVLEVAEDGSITMKLDADSGKFPEAKETEKEKDAEKAAEKQPPRGRVGFYWEGVKFVVIRVEVTGVLDREWAKEQIDGAPAK